MEFTPFPKIPRLSRNMVVTEKIDGTNASVLIRDVHVHDFPSYVIDAVDLGEGMHRVMLAGSRTRWVTPRDDNHGFAKWVQDHSDQLFQLGEGHHFGEWWGRGIQRGYGLDEKRFSLFNTGRWYDGRDHDMEDIEGRNPVPECCHVVPTLLAGPFDQEAIELCVELLRQRGSQAAPGFMKPEGIVVWHEASRQMFKKTLVKDESPKGLVAA